MVLFLSKSVQSSPEILTSYALLLINHTNLSVEAKRIEHINLFTNHADKGKAKGGRHTHSACERNSAMHYG